MGLGSQNLRFDFFLSVDLFWWSETFKSDKKTIKKGICNEIWLSFCSFLTEKITCFVTFWIKWSQLCLTKTQLEAWKRVQHKDHKVTLKAWILCFEPCLFFMVFHCVSVFQHPVQVSPKQRQQYSAATIPPPPSTCNKYFPRRTLPRWTQSNKQYGCFYWKPECLLERANDLIVDCVSMSECLTKLPTRVERRREEEGAGAT